VKCLRSTVSRTRFWSKNQLGNGSCRAGKQLFLD